MTNTESKKITPNFQENIKWFNETLNVDGNFDVIYRVLQFGGTSACFYYIDGFVKDDVMQKLMEFFYKLDDKTMPQDAYTMLKKQMPYIEIDMADDKETIIQGIMSGISAMLIDGFDKVIMVDSRTYPMRGVDEPEKDKVLRGSRDGFVETLVSNTALIRRRIRNTNLTMQITTVGRTSRTDVVLCYMKDRVDQKLLDNITKRIDAIDVDALTMNQESLAECLLGKTQINPFPKFKYSERPDAAAANVLEGNIIVLVDNSPAAMILPTSIFDMVEESDDYYFPPVVGTYLRISRLIINILAVVLTPLFLLLMNNPQYIPKGMEFIQTKESVNVPLVLQFIMLEFFIDGLRLAAINTPNMLSTPLSVAAGLIIGDFTVSSGWFNAEAMLYEAFVALATYTQASFEVGYALKFMRLVTLLLTQFFHLWGFIGGIVITLLLIAFNKTVSGKSYLYPLIPFHGKQLLNHFFRQSLPQANKNRNC